MEFRRRLRDSLLAWRLIRSRSRPTLALISSCTNNTIRVKYQTCPSLLRGRNEAEHVVKIIFVLPIQLTIRFNPVYIMTLIDKIVNKINTRKLAAKSHSSNKKSFVGSK